MRKVEIFSEKTPPPVYNAVLREQRANFRCETNPNQPASIGQQKLWWPFKENVRLHQKQ